MTTVAELCAFLDCVAPPALAAEWDNVGLLVGDRAQKVERVMTCLTITPAAAAEAIRERADLIVTHHPLPFKPLKRLTADQASMRQPRADKDHEYVVGCRWDDRLPGWRGTEGV